MPIFSHARDKVTHLSQFVQDCLVFKAESPASRDPLRFGQNEMAGQPSEGE